MFGQPSGHEHGIAAEPVPPDPELAEGDPDAAREMIDRRLLGVVPGQAGPPSGGAIAIISSSLVAVIGHGGRLGTRLGSTTSLRFSDPTRATVRTVDIVNGTTVRDQQRLLDLTEETVALQLGRPDAALITQHLDAHQVTTLMQGVLGNTSVRSDVTARSRSTAGTGNTLPSPAMLRGVRAVEDAVQMSVR